MRVWTEADVRALGVTTDLVTAGSVLGLSRNTAYGLNAEGRFPTRVLTLGSQYRVPVSDLLSLLGLDGEAAPGSAAPAPTTPGRRRARHVDGATITTLPA